MDVLMLKSQIADLEYQSRNKISTRLQMIRGQIESLQARRQNWSECMQGYFQKGPDLKSSL